ncbi:MAG: ATP synthase F1 subunit epsilon [Candidatus Neomarinimicrobiota bacterium]|nr:ATP synthase F1 subunit epsilon [Candidatus Neomarinimicrobiota bacterium]|tara:strand:+ start:3732 stop:4136 length:405 start_codon:yes stop_codon:yes gene_type:complete
MSKTFQLDIITPTSIISEGQVEYLRAPSKEGLFGVKKGHASSLIVMDIGEIKITKDGKECYYATNGGFADIRPESVMLLVETAEKNDKIDKKRAEKALQRAKERLKDNASDLKRAKAAIERSRNRIKIVDRISS